MNDKCILIIPVIDENPNIFSKLITTFKKSEFCNICFTVSPKNKHIETYKSIVKEYNNYHLLISEKHQKRGNLYMKGLAYFNTQIKRENDNFKYILSIKKFNNDYIDLIIDGLLEIQKTSLDIIYCLAENRKKTFNSRVKNRIKKSIVDTFRSPLFIASYKFVDTIYSNPFNKFKTFYYLIRNAKTKPIYS